MVTATHPSRKALLPESVRDDRGHLVLFLHAHLPYVRHPSDEDFLEEDWLYEAITDTYIPLLAVSYTQKLWMRVKKKAAYLPG